MVQGCCEEHPFCCGHPLSPSYLTLCYPFVLLHITPFCCAHIISPSTTHTCHPTSQQSFLCTYHQPTQHNTHSVTYDTYTHNSLMRAAAFCCVHITSPSNQLTRHHTHQNPEQHHCSAIHYSCECTQQFDARRRASPDPAVESFIKQSVGAAGLLDKVFGGQPPKLSTQVRARVRERVRARVRKSACV